MKFKKSFLRNGSCCSKEEKKSLSYFALFKYASICEKNLIAFAMLLALISGCMMSIDCKLFSKLCGAMVEYGSSKRDERAQDEFNEVVVMFSIGNCILATILVICNYLSTVLMNYTALSQIFKIKREYLQAVLNQDVEWYDLNKTGDFAEKMAGDIMKLQDGMGEKITNFIHFFVSFLSTIVMAMTTGPKLTLISITTIPFVLIITAIVERVAAAFGRKEAVAYSKAATTAEEVLSSIRTVFAFNGQKKEVDRFQIDLIDAKKINIKKNIYFGIGVSIAFLFTHISIGLSLWFGVYFVLKDEYTPADMVAVFFGVIMAIMNLKKAMPLLEMLGAAKGSAEKIFETIDHVPKINPLLDRGVKPNHLDGEVIFKNVHFHYPSRPDVKVLKGISFTIKRGQTAAFVGTSGCGKSTIVQLIQRFYDAIDGSVNIDNNDVRNLSVKWLRSKIGVVGQEPVLFNTTIKNNIRYGCEQATDEQIYAAAREANAHRFIKKLPMGYDSIVGERGTQLSGGQKQRIAIARALVRDPPILLLDEATSALDTSSEAKVQKALTQACKGRTTLVVAHRLTTIRTADVILSFQSGQLMESGTHEQLMQNKGLYFEMVMAQETPSIEDTERKKDLRHQQSTVSTCSTIKGDEHKELEPTSNETKTEPKESFFRILALSKPEWKLATVACVCSIIMGAGLTSCSFIFGTILGSLSLADTDLLRQRTTIYSVMSVIAGLIICVTCFIKIYIFGVTGERLTERLRSQIFEKYLSQDVSWFDDKNNSTGALCARLSAEASAVQGATGQRIGTLLEALGTITVAAFFIFYYEWRLGLVALVILPGLMFLLYKQSSQSLQSNYMNTKSEENSTKIAIDAVSNIRTVISLSNEKMFVNLYTEEMQPVLLSSQKKTQLRAIVYGVARGTANFAMAICMFYGGYLIRHNGVNYQNIVIAVHSMIMCTMAVTNAFVYAPNFENGINAANRILKLFKISPSFADPVTPVRENFVSSGPVTYSHVNFTYPKRPNTIVLKDLNLEIKSGQTVALVGASGCGKSTVIQLLERFYDPCYGDVELAGYNLKRVKQAELRRNLGIVQQEPVLFDRTIGENIAYGDNSRKVTESEIIAVAKQANIHDFVISLPLGYDTRLGTKGTQLSGGQKQRVAIARALLRNPKILLLDEATSALDVESENVVQAALNSAKVGRTCIIIAHRLSTVKDADVICVFDGGRVAEKGTHSELMAKEGLYFKLHHHI